MSDKVKEFIEEVLKVCKKHGLSISHEDGHGMFEIEEYNEQNCRWLLAAKDLTK